MVRGEGGVSVSVKEEAPMKALIVTDSFDRRFSTVLSSHTSASFVSDSSFSCLRLANIEILHYTLEWISRTEVRDIILVVASQKEATLDQIVAYWGSCFSSLTVVACQHCMSVGDAIREVYARSLIDGDILLITSPATFCSSDLAYQIKAHNERRREKNNVMTLIYCKSEGSNPPIGYEKKTNKLVFFHHSDGDLSSRPNMVIDKSVFISDTIVRRDIQDTGIALCSASVSSQFSDNFDFQHRDDIIREILVNEEILCQNIHVEILPDDQAACTLSDFEGLLRANRLVLQRWLSPLTPGRVGGARFISQRGNLFYAVDNNKSDHFNLANSKCVTCLAGPNVVFGLDCEMASSAVIKRSSIGNGTKICEGAEVLDSMLGQRVTIGRDARVSGAYVGDDVSIGEGTIVEPRCIIANRVSIPSEKVVPSDSVICVEQCPEDEEDITSTALNYAGYEWKFVDGSSFWRCSAKNRLRIDSSSVVDRDVDGTAERTDDEAFPEKDMDTTEKFFEEVRESMERIAQEESITDQLMKNLILEINSSKLAYNISMEDVAKYVFLSFLALSKLTTFASIESTAKEWKLLFTNYFKPERSQIQALIAIEDHLNAKESFRPLVAKTVHLFYNLDVIEEDAILEWDRTLAEGAPIKGLVAPIVQWLQQPDDDDDDDEEEEANENSVVN